MDRDRVAGLPTNHAPEELETITAAMHWVSLAHCKGQLRDDAVRVALRWLREGRTPQG